MRIAILSLTTLFLTAPLLAAEPARLISLELLDQEVSRLENENAELRARMDSLESSMLDGTVHLAGRGVETCPAWNAEYELTILRPFMSNALDFGDRFSNNFGTGHRFILGRENATGLGLRGRYGLFNDRHEVLPVEVGGVLAATFDLDVADLEMTLREQLGSCDLLFSAGLRYGRLNISLLPVDVGNSPLQAAFEGVGPTLALEVQRPVRESGFYWIGNLRSSVLIGDIHNTDGLLVAAPNIEDETMLVLENQLGVGWKCSGWDLRAAWETQFWMNDTFAHELVGLGSNFTFTGLTLRAGVTW